ncbi:MAG: helix-turn-helix domain-containing protein [Pseudonocardiaceae bacterium]
MGQQPKELTPHQNLHHYWGAELRTLRTTRRLSLAELGKLLHCDPSYLAKIERAERPIPTTLAHSCDRALEADGVLVRLHALAEATTEQTTKPATQTQAHVASDNTHVANQTGNLTSGATTLPAVPDTDDEIIVPARTSDGRVIYVSVPRRVFLHGLGSTAVGLTATSGIETPGTHRPASLPAPGDIHPIEHFQQLRQVLRDNDRLFGPRRVIPVVREQIAVIQHLRSDWRGADQRELVRVQAQYSEFCGWLYRDAGEHQLAESWTDRALGLSHLAADHDLTVFILARKAGLAGDMGVSADAVGMGEQALRLAPPTSRLAAYAATFTGHGYALNGDQVEMERSYDRAVELLDTGDVDPHSPLGPWFGEKWIALSRARSLTILGDYQPAAESFRVVIAELPSDSRRGRGVYLARAALAIAGDRQVEHAVTLGLEALAIGAETHSARILTELAQLNDALAPWNSAPAVADFRTAMKDTLSHQA